MNLRDLRYLVALAELRHFGRAAAACGVTQPALSAQLKKVEAELGSALFMRAGRSVRPTPAGARIVAQARRVLAEAERIPALARDPDDPLAGRLRLGILPSLCPHLLPALVAGLKEAAPGCSLALDEDATEALVAGLGERRLDAALLPLPAADPALAAEPLFDEPWFALLPRGHRLAANGDIAPAELARGPGFVPPREPELREGLAALVGAQPAADGAAVGLATLRGLVVAGLAVGLAPALAAGQAPGLVARRIAGADAKRRIGLVFPRGAAAAAELRRIAEAVRVRLPPGVKPVARRAG